MNSTSKHPLFSLAIAPAFLLLLSSPAFAEKPTDNLVKGFAKYQAGRVENIALDSFLDDLANEKYLKQFFPSTSENIIGYQGVSGKRLIPIISHYFQQDLETMESLGKCVKTNLQPLSTPESLDKAKLETSIKTINWLLHMKKEPHLTSNDVIIELACATSDKKSQTALWEERKKEESYKKPAYIKIPEINDNVWKAKDKLVNTLNGAIESHFQQETGWYSFAYRDNDDALKNVDIKALLRATKELSKLDDNTDTTLYIHHLNLLLKSLSFDVADNDGYQRLISTGIFLSDLQKAAKNGNNSPDQVAAVIQDFVNEDEVYKNKRNEVAMFSWQEKESGMRRCSYLVLCNNTWFVGSYFGFALGQGTETEKMKQRIFGPIGVEFKYFSGSFMGKNISATFMASPIDLGIYVSNELTQTPYGVSANDILVESYFTSISSKSSPMSVQLGSKKDTTTKQGEHLWFVALSYDLPLFTLW